MATLIFYTVVDFIAILLVAISDRINRLIKINFEKCGYLSLSDVLYFSSGLLLFLIVALRDNVGADYSIYTNAYLSIIDDDLNDTEKNWLGRGYVALCECIGLLAGDSYHWMFAIVAAITIFAFYSAFYIANKQRTWSVLLFIGFCLYYQCFNQVRQMMAVAICAIAYIALMKESKRYFVLIVIIESLFHTSAIVMLVLLLVNKLKINISRLCCFAFIALASVVGFNVLVDLLSNTFYGAIYFGSEMYDVSFKTSVIVNTIFRVLLLAFCMLFYKRLISDNNNKLLINAGFVCLFFQILTLQSYLFGRITTYFFIAYLFAMPRVFELVSKKFVVRDRVLVKTFWCVCIILYHYIYYYMVAKNSGYNEYNTFLF